MRQLAALISALALAGCATTATAVKPPPVPANLLTPCPREPTPPPPGATKGQLSKWVPALGKSGQECRALADALQKALK